MDPLVAVRTLGALAHESRLALFRLLVQAGPDGLPAGRIAGQLGLANTTLSFHLKEMAHAELVHARQEGRYVFYTANFDAMNALVAYLTENCCGGAACGPVAACAPAAPVRAADS